MVKDDIVSHAINNSIQMLTERITHATYVIPLEIEVRELERDLVSGECDDLPCTHLVRWIDIWKGRTVESSVGGFEDPTASLWIINWIFGTPSPYDKPINGWLQQFNSSARLAQHFTSSRRYTPGGVGLRSKYCYFTWENHFYPIIINQFAMQSFQFQFIFFNFTLVIGHFSYACSLLDLVKMYNLMIEVSREDKSIYPSWTEETRLY